MMMPKPLVLVTGKNGQLGWELMQLYHTLTDRYDFMFTGRDELDLTDPSSIPSFFQKHTPAYLVNCAAYTGVDKAETEQEAAYTINAVSTGMLAQQCALAGSTLIQLSTDYVFDGNGKEPYRPDTPTDHPVNYYGYTKWMGEQLAAKNNPRTLIIRTSWVYSTHGNNFVKTMLRLMKERTELKVVSDQKGTPTYARDLAEAILTIIGSLEQGNRQYGIYHFSNAGETTWFEFAKAIRDLARLPCEVLPIASASYPTPAKRPAYSVLDKTAIVENYKIVLNNWKDSLQQCLQALI